MLVLFSWNLLYLKIFKENAKRRDMRETEMINRGWKPVIGTLQNEEI